MSDNPNGGPAFPAHGTMGEIVEHGISARDYFAAKAMQAAAISPMFAETFDIYERARWAYAQADAMLAERAK